MPLKPAVIELETDLPHGLATVAYRLPGFESSDFAAGQVLRTSWTADAEVFTPLCRKGRRSPRGSTDGSRRPHWAARKRRVSPRRGRGPLWCPR